MTHATNDFSIETVKACPLKVRPAWVLGCQYYYWGQHRKVTDCVVFSCSVCCGRKVKEMVTRELSLWYSVIPTVDLDRCFSVLHDAAGNKTDLDTERRTEREGRAHTHKLAHGIRQTNIHIHTHTYTHAYTHTYTHMHAHIYTHPHTHTHTLWAWSPVTEII